MRQVGLPLSRLLDTGPVTQTQKLVTLLSIPEEKYASGGMARQEEWKEGTEVVKTLAKGDVSINLHKALFTACVFVFFIAPSCFCC